LVKQVVWDLKFVHEARPKLENIQTFPPLQNK